MKGTKIVVTGNPKGHFEDVYVAGIPKPGVVMCIEPGTEPIGGLFTYEMYGTTAASGEQYVSASGNRMAIAILIEKKAEGKYYDDAYADDDLGTIYWPLPGETFNMIIANVAGTSDTFVIGQQMMVEDGTGQLVTSSSSEALPFTMLETVDTALAADTHKWVRFNGSGA
jgi:hypothetical protein